MALPLTTAIAATITSCTVPERGLTGVKLDAAGRLTAVLAWCPRRPPHGLTLYTDDDRPELKIHFWAPVFRDTYAEAPLAELPAGWSSTVKMPALDPRREYHLYGWTENNSSGTRAVDFTLAKLQSNEPGTILIQRHDDKTGSWRDSRLSTDEFRSAVEPDVGCEKG